MKKSPFLLALSLAAAVAACGAQATTPIGAVHGDDAGAPGDDVGSGDDAGLTVLDDGAVVSKDGAVVSKDAIAPPPDGGPVSSSSVKIIVEPGDNGAALVAAIKGATKSVHMTMYLFTSTDVMNALIVAKQHGLDVKVILNQSFPTNTNQNASSYNTLKSNNVPVVYAPAAFTYTHEKCVIVDGKEAWIMTMNATKTSPTDNREYLAVDDDPADVAEADAIFNADYANTAYTPSGKLLVAPTNARDGMLQLIASATHTIDVEGEEFSDTKIATALAQKASAGVAVRLVVASGNTVASQQQAIATVKQSGVKVMAQSTPYIHAKALVVDGVRAYVGSANFSTGSLLYNRELGLIVDNATEVAKVSAAIATDFSSGTPQ